MTYTPPTPTARPRGDYQLDLPFPLNPHHHHKENPMTREQRFAKLEVHVERLLNLGRCFVLSGWEMAGVVEMAQDAEVDVDVRWNARGWWVVLKEKTT